MIGVEARGGIIKALRLIGLGTDFSREMIRVIQKQQGKRISQVDYNNLINRIYKECDCEKMVRQSIVQYATQGHDETRKVGRPAVPDDKMRKNRTFKTTDGEWEQIKALARKSGMTTSEYIRERVLKTQE